MGEALPRPLEVRHVLPPPREQLRGVAPVGGQRRGGREGLVVLEDEVARAARPADHLGLVIGEPQAPVAEALPLTEGVVRGVAELLGGVVDMVRVRVS